jgi:hypothetical protein
LVLAYLHKFALPDGRIHRAMNNLALISTATRLPEDRCQEIATAMLRAGQLRQDGEDLYLVVAAR